MIKRIFLVALVIIAAVGNLFSQEKNLLFEKEKAEGYRLLFNGTNLDGWVIHGTEKWVAENGMISASSGPDKGYGYLATDRNYQDFELRPQFKLEASGNSGVFFRSNLKGTDITGWQVEVAPPGENTGGIYESGGRGWLFEIPENKENILKPGEWNDLVILLKGDHVMSWLNGQLMTDLTDEAIGKGKGVIALQIHSGGGVGVSWKNIRIREM